MNDSMRPRWITLVHEVTCLGCRKRVDPGYHAYSLTGSEGAVYCFGCGQVAERAMQQNAADRERNRRIIAGLPV